MIFSEYDHGNYYKVQGLGFRVKKKMETIRMGYIGIIGYTFFEYDHHPYLWILGVGL